MPLYPYHCMKCGHRFEKIQKFGAKPEEVCPKCGGVLERTLTAPGLSFKGAGWYVNDYAPKSASSNSASGGRSSADSAPVETKTGGEAKTESKSESKSTSGGESSSSRSSTSAPATTPGKAAK